MRTAQAWRVGRTKQILDDAVAPRLRAGDPTGGLEAGIDAMIAVTRGEYQATQGRKGAGGDSFPVGFGTLLVIALLFIVVVRLQGGLGSTMYTGRGWRGGGWGGGGWGSGGWGGGGGRRRRVLRRRGLLRRRRRFGELVTR